jgi:HicB family
MAPDKTADAIKLNLRLPKPLHKRLKQQARRNNVSLNTEIVNQLEGAEAAAVERIAETIAPLIDRAAKARLEPYFAFQTRLKKILDFFNEAHGRPPDTVKELQGWIDVKGWGIPEIWEDDLRPEEK